MLQVQLRSQLQFQIVRPGRREGGMRDRSTTEGREAASGGSIRWESVCRVTVRGQPRVFRLIQLSYLSHFSILLVGQNRITITVCDTLKSIEQSARCKNMQWNRPLDRFRLKKKYSDQDFTEIHSTAKHGVPGARLFCLAYSNVTYFFITHNLLTRSRLFAAFVNTLEVSERALQRLPLLPQLKWIFSH